MDKRPRRPSPINTELQALEQDLAALTLRVAEIRRRVTPRPRRNQRLPIVGDRVRFHLAGRYSAEGVIIGITAHRVRIRQDSTHHVFLRAPQNVSII
jgi:hypothetical protein